MLIGRERELALVRDALETHRVVTLIGPGGVGKTTLANAVIEKLVERERLFVDLAPIRAGDVEAGVAGSLGVASMAKVTDSIGESPTTVVLDNCEHVLDEAADLAVALAASGPHLSVLATSRERLDLPIEQVIVIDPLPTDGDRSPAVQLFLAVARRRGSTFEHDPASVAALARRLDGLPLALELAAVRSASATPAEMLRHLDARIDILSRARRRGPVRQQSLEATIAWSYQLLDPTEQTLFERLAIFPASFSAPMAIAAAGEDAASTIDRLGRLVDRSLLVNEPSAGRSWYRMLETIREYGAHRLEETGDRGDTEDRIVEQLIVRTAELLQADRPGGMEPTAGAEMGRTWRTRAWAVDLCHRAGRVDRCVRLLEPLWLLEDVGHQGEAADLAERVLEGRAIDTDQDTAAVFGAVAALHLTIGRVERATELATRVVAVDHGLGAAHGQRVLGIAARRAGRWDDAERCFQAGEAAARRVGDELLEAEIAMHRSLSLARAGERARAVTELEALGASHGHLELARTWVAVFLGWILLVDAPDRSRALAESILPEAEARSDGWAMASAELNLAVVELTTDGDLAAAAALTATAIDRFRATRNRSDIALAFHVAAGIASLAGFADEAKRLKATAEREFVAAERGPFERELFGWLGPAGPIPATTDRLSAAEAVDLLRSIAASSAPTVADGQPARPAIDEAARFARDGDGWSLTWAGTTSRVGQAKGMDDLAQLLARPGQEVASVDLAGAGLVDRGAGPAIDTNARRRYEQRIQQLQADLDEAEAANDHGRAELARAELDRLVDELGAAYGLGGRERRSGSSAERARSTVRWRIRAAIDRIGDVDPDLGAHLDRSVVTGRFCRYDPAEPVRWVVG